MTPPATPISYSPKLRLEAGLRWHIAAATRRLANATIGQIKLGYGKADELAYGTTNGQFDPLRMFNNHVRGYGIEPIGSLRAWTTERMSIEMTALVDLYRNPDSRETAIATLADALNGPRIRMYGPTGDDDELNPRRAEFLLAEAAYLMEFEPVAEGDDFFFGGRPEGGEQLTAWRHVMHVKGQLQLLEIETGHAAVLDARPISLESDAADRTVGRS